MREYPVYIDGAECGKMIVRADGLLTVFEIRCRPARGGVIRLYACGGGESGLLGTLQPSGGEMRLVRRLSRAERGRLPGSIEYASDSPAPKAEAADGDTLWRRGKMGCLVSGGSIAVPAEGGRLARVSDRLRRIDGRLYLVFERKR